MSMYVDKGYRSDKPERDLAALVARRGIGPAEHYFGLLTGVSLEDAVVVAEGTDGPEGRAEGEGRRAEGWGVDRVHCSPPSSFVLLPSAFCHPHGHRPSAYSPA